MRTTNGKLVLPRISDVMRVAVTLKSGKKGDGTWSLSLRVFSKLKVSEFLIKKLKSG